MKKFYSVVKNNSILGIGAIDRCLSGIINFISYKTVFAFVGAFVKANKKLVHWLLRIIVYILLVIVIKKLIFSIIPKSIFTILKVFLFFI